jgi:SAM-dependent MidA family methyltransferase
MTVAAFMELALYHPELGYYARAARRSGRTGDFFTSVDVGPLFGELLATQLAEMAAILSSAFGIQNSFDLVEAGAGNGRLSADILGAARAQGSRFYDSIRLHLSEVSPQARAAHTSTLGDHAGRLVWSDSALPGSFEGVLLANELLDALPVHQVVMREGGLREVYVAIRSADDSDGARRLRAEGASACAEASASAKAWADRRSLGGGWSASLAEARADNERAEAGGLSRATDGEALALTEGPVSTPALNEYLEQLGVELQPGWRIEINLRAVEWIHEAARHLRRGFIMVIDYGHEARELYSPTHAAGTLTTFSRHQSTGPEAPGVPAWLQSPGNQDITSHVDFTSVRAAAEAEGLQTLGFMDQTYFLLGLLPPDIGDRQSIRNHGESTRNPQPGPPQRGLGAVGWESAIRNLKTLILPGGLGSTHKVMIFGKGVGTPGLRGCSYRMRVT